ncbi:hypothetical protein FB451DRAFT_1193284 [Mycena latifolia]|nr:hypothetical protein FB451DRAFT_1193284 [Mycena latifolia]
MAERLANKGSAETTWGEEDEPEYKRSDRFPTVKIERRDARIDELGGELSGLRDALVVAQKQSKAAHEELLKALKNRLNILLALYVPAVLTSARFDDASPVTILLPSSLKSRIPSHITISRVVQFRLSALYFIKVHTGEANDDRIGQIRTQSASPRFKPFISLKSSRVSTYGCRVNSLFFLLAQVANACPDPHTPTLELPTPRVMRANFIKRRPNRTSLIC